VSFLAIRELYALDQRSFFHDEEKAKGFPDLCWQKSILYDFLYIRFSLDMENIEDIELVEDVL